MSLIKEWNELTKSQTDESFPSFWEKYSKSEERLYAGLLANKGRKLEGSFKEIAETYDVEPVIMAGFLDGINSSLKKSLDLGKINEESQLSLAVDEEKLYHNMLVADAKHLYALDEWDSVLSVDTRADIEKTYKQSRTITKEKEPGRNDPCPCGSGKKYKKCCGG